MLTAELFMTDKRQEQARYPRTTKWTNKMRFVHTMTYYSALLILAHELESWPRGLECLLYPHKKIAIDMHIP